MVCEHLSTLEQLLITRGVAITYRGQAWSMNCREWVYFDCFLDTSAIRKRHGIPDEFGSCHTGVVAGYALEGHVPADEVKRLLAQQPAAAGLSVPGMPVGTPGMEVGSRKVPFQVLLIDKAGRSSVFANYPKT